MRRTLSVVALSLIAVASTASAQRPNQGGADASNPPVELGFDAARLAALRAAKAIA